MGRHTASISIDEPPRTEGLATGPITDPILLDQVAAQLEAARRAREAGRSVALPDARRPASPRDVRASTPVVAEHLERRAPKAVAPIVLPQPRAAATHSASLAFTDVPVDVSPRLAAVPLTTKPLPVIGSFGRIGSGPSTAPILAPTPSRGRRGAAIAACAIAVLGAVSAAAVVLPTPAEAVGSRSGTSTRHSSIADATGTRTTVDPATGPGAHHRHRARVRYVHWKFLGLAFSMPSPATGPAETRSTAPDPTPASSTPAGSTSSGSTPSQTPSKTRSATPKPSASRTAPSERTTAPGAPIVGSGGSTAGFVVGVTKPSAKNTGAGVIRPYPTKVINGDVTLTGNQTLKDTIVHGRVSVKGTNNVVENCVITGPVDRGYTGYVWLVNTTSATNAVVRFNTIRAAHTSAYVNGIGLKNVTAERNDISRVIDGFDIDTGSSADKDVHTTIRGNYIHDLMFYGADPNHSPTPTPASYTGPWAKKPWSHDDGIQITSGTGLSVVGNTIDASWADDIGTLPLPTYVNELSAMMITAPRGPITGLTVHANWFDGGAYSINAGGAAGSGTFTGNRFGRHIQGSGNSSFTLVFDSRFNATTSNNTYEDSGAAVQVRRNY